MGVNAFVDTGNFVIRAGVDKNNTEKAILLILEELDKIKKNPPSAEELNRAKDYYEGRLKISLEDSADVASYYGSRVLFYKDNLSPSELVKKIKKVRAEEIQFVARELFNRKNISLSIIGPFKNKNIFEKLLNY